MRKKIKVDWIKGKIKPSVDGDYFVIKKNDEEHGDYYVTIDWWDADDQIWDDAIDPCCGYVDENYTVEAWAFIPKPIVPNAISDKVEYSMGDKACKEIIYEPTMEESSDENQT